MKSSTGENKMAAMKMCIRKSKEETAEWTGLFPSDLKTEQESLVFVKRMMAVAVSSITYLRGIFPEDAYRSRYVEDLCIKVLREDCATPGASKVVKWMMGSFDALEKRYVGSFIHEYFELCIIESYQFKFKYTEKGPEMDILRNNDVEAQVTLEDTKRALVLLIRKLFLLMQNLNALPNNVCLTMKLYYYDDITPDDYQPPGFREGECDSLWFEGMAVHFKVGEVQTPFHTLRVRVSAEQGRLEKLKEWNQGTETKQVPQSNPPQRELIEDPRKRINDEEDIPSEDESAQFKKPKRPVAKRLAAARTLLRKRRRI
ncbi:zebrafish testis-expressed 38 isoform X2 [Epinephelus fuscoguttatus]|uniref:zebrafish testis-expressed 38 isoform X2 n=1 Tax=Epinephelus fuscoguttatus TaxID=293821 RepID=UPI0020D15084|nr:zebrafish testis-expressed 38 isoform X2 [Epinephelus fuscoguttatus]